MGFLGAIPSLFGGTASVPGGTRLGYDLDYWLKKMGGSQQWQDALTQAFSQAKTAQQFGTPFYESLIPKSPGELSPAASAEKSAATDALQTRLGSAGVAQLGQLGREYGGRLPASMVQSGFGSLARAGAGGAADIARQAIGENVNLGEQGVAGLAGLTNLGLGPISTVLGVPSAVRGGLYSTPGAINSIANTAGNVAGKAAGAIAGFSGLGGGGGSGSVPGLTPNLPLGGVGFGGLGMPIPGTLQQSSYNPYLNIGR